MKKKFFLIFTMCFLSFPVFARDEIRIVGSSTVYPFATIISEHFARNTGYENPIVEATGTGTGFSIFCSGVGFSYPDINDASRKITKSEINQCLKNGIVKPIEIPLGYDGIGLLYNKKLGKLNFTKKQLFLAMSAKIPSKDNANKWVNNYYKNWSDIDKSLPNIPIKVMGPPASSGTRDTFVELVLRDSCPIINSKKFSSKQKADLCGRIRYDGAWVDGSENYNLVLQKISSSNHTIAIVGYNYYNNNKNIVNAAKINSIELSKKNIMDEKYPLSRPLYIYVKKEHLDAILGLRAFVSSILQENMLGKEGYLAQQGLIPMKTKLYKSVVKNVQSELNK